MKNLALFSLLITLYGCHPTAKKATDEKSYTFSKQEKKEINVMHSVLQNTSDSKNFNQSDPDCKWQYHYPFQDSTYVFAIQNCGEEYIEKEKNTRIYFGIDGRLADKIIWTENIYLQPNGGGTVAYEDYNDDDVKDLLIFKETGARGSNEYHYLYLIDQKKNEITKVRGFNDIVNPSYNKKHQVILSYSFAGANYYSIYRILNFKVCQIGEAFEDSFDGDAGVLDQKILQILSEN